jgi:serine/threonine protein kinase
MTSAPETGTTQESDLPAKLGKYEVRGIIGRGAMGVVYLADDPFGAREVAIKVGPPAGSDDASRLSHKLFFNEARLAGLLDHPNILKVYDAGEEEGRPYMVLEYVKNARTLRPYCQPDSLLPLRQVAEIAYKCARALDYAHRSGVVHRDIKATNILLTPDDDVKIGDFGIARHLHSDTTQVLGMLGSPRYMSPEQASEEDVDHQSDIYSLGVVLFELVTGHPPFEAESLSRLVYKILHEDPLRPRDLRPDLPAALEAVILKALQKDRRQRFAMGNDFAMDLAQAFEHLERIEDDVDAQERFNAARPLAFFRDFSAPELWEVVRAGTWESYTTGDRIVSEGALDGRLYVVVSGDVMVKKGTRSLSTLGPGDCFGEIGYFAKAPRTATIYAINAVTVLGVNAALMEQAACGLQLKFHRAFVRALVTRLTRTSEALVRA